MEPPPLDCGQYGGAMQERTAEAPNGRPADVEVEAPRRAAAENFYASADPSVLRAAAASARAAKYSLGSAGPLA